MGPFIREREQGKAKIGTNEDGTEATFLTRYEVDIVSDTVPNHVRDGLALQLKGHAVMTQQDTSVALGEQAEFLRAIGIDPTKLLEAPEGSGNGAMQLAVDKATEPKEGETSKTPA